MKLKIFLFLVVIVTGLFGYFMFKANSVAPLASQTITNYLRYSTEGETEKAYELLHSRFKDSSLVIKWEEANNKINSLLKENGYVNFKYQNKVSHGFSVYLGKPFTLSYNGEATFANNKKIPIYVELAEENNQWKILNIRIVPSFAN